MARGLPEHRWRCAFRALKTATTSRIIATFLREIVLVVISDSLAIALYAPRATAVRIARPVAMERGRRVDRRPRVPHALQPATISHTLATRPTELVWIVMRVLGATARCVLPATAAPAARRASRDFGPLEDRWTHAMCAPE